MQITIVQSEMEEAITDYIRRQISINEGMAIDIDLRATRGAEGFQAIINIRPVAESDARMPAAQSASIVSTPAPDVTDVPEPTKPLKIQETVTKAKEAPKATKSPKTAAPKPEPEITLDDVMEVTDAENDSSADPEADTSKVKSLFGQQKGGVEGQAADAAGDSNDTNESSETAAPKSIFGGMKRPVNA